LNEHWNRLERPSIFLVIVEFALFLECAAMAVQLDIVWEGDAPGLQEHRLSLGAFGEALTTLLAALRRIATNIVGDAVEGETAEVGRFASAARRLDIQIEGIKKNSSGFAGMVSLYTPQGETMRLFNELPEVAGIQLLEAVEAESKGVLKNSAVRRYLRALPSGVYRQVYVLHDNGNEFKRVELGSMSISDVLSDLPYLAEVHGRIVGVGFDPGKNEVRIKSDEGNHLTLMATPMHVENALDLRSSPVKALAVIQESGSRLLRLQEAGRGWSVPSREDAIFKRWEGLLRRLAQ
jgi:hypothetical protein